MIKMFKEDKVIIAPDLKVKELQAKNMELDEIIEYAITKGYAAEDILFPADAFTSEFLEMLHHDREILEQLNADWEKENDDPKFDKFQENLTHNFFDKEINPSGKLVLFSESVDTLNYLYDRLTKEIGRSDVLMVTAANRNRLEQTIKENFDANFDSDSMRYNIIITSDVLAEGVNLHRSNVIVNYDSPWNATRLMQRIGRVNRIGSVAPNIYNYMFYPSQQGDKEIQLYKNALVKLQGFHSAFGEDAQIYSKEEIVKELQMFDNNVKDSIDKKIALLREVRELYNSDRKLYHKIKALPMKSRVMRDTGKHSGKSIIFVSSNVKTEFYLATTTGVEVIDFLEAVKYLKAKPEEQPVPFSNEEQHYKHVNSALAQYTTEYVEAADTSSINRTDLDKTSLEANKFLRTIKQITADSELKLQCDVLMGYINEGIYAQLPRYLKALSREYKNDRAKMKQDEYSLQNKISELLGEYQTMNKEQRHDAQDISNPQIIISESFK
jgi:ATP-dependent helicase